jgi:hypothetical protein
MHAQYFGLWAQYIVAKSPQCAEHWVMGPIHCGLWAQYIVAKALCYNKLTLCVCVWVQYIVAKALCYKIFSRHCLCVFGCNRLWPKRCVIKSSRDTLFVCVWVQ